MDSKPVKPYSLRTAALTGSATAGSLLVRDEPEICQPANCWGRMEAAGAVLSAQANPARDAASAKAQMSLGNFMNNTESTNPLGIRLPGSQESFQGHREGIHAQFVQMLLVSTRKTQQAAFLQGNSLYG